MDSMTITNFPSLNQNRWCRLFLIIILIVIIIIIEFCHSFNGDHVIHFDNNDPNHRSSFIDRYKNHHNNHDYSITKSSPMSSLSSSVSSQYSFAKRKPLDKSKLKYIEIGGLFPMNGTTGWLGGQGCLPAAMMALEDVNNNENLLSGYYLNITWNNSQVK